jgi:outer membrane receptor protein involved in Fe transport
MGARKTSKKRGPKGLGRRRQTLTAVGSNALVLSTFFLNGAFAAETAAEAAPAEGPPVESAAGETAQPAQGPALSEVVVTGTHIVRDGYSAPAPLTVVGEEAIKSQGTTNIADFVNTLPQFAGSTQPNATNSTTSSGMSGINALNLRSLGPQRTLVLVDGQRVVGVDTTQLVDINLIPQSLIKRIDVVTGGASAQYGSDAVAGVVNFILDKDFTGFKTDASAGETAYNDDRQWDISVTGGMKFSDGRGHALFNLEAKHEDGVQVNNRPWNLVGKQFIANPNYTATNGQPQWEEFYNVSPMTTLGNAAIIASGPLKGISFGQGGQQFLYHYGNIVSSPDNVNSPDFATTQVRGTISGGGLTSLETTQNAFGRLSYDVTDDIEVFGQASWAHNYNYNWCCTVEDSGNVKVLSGNPFIPANIQSAMTAQGLSSISLGTQNPDLGQNGGLNNRRTQRFVLGANGKLNLLSTDWKWDAYYQKGISYQHNQATNVIDYTYYNNAVDAVVGPNGNTVCRVTLTNPNSPCQPYNPFGTGVNSAQAIRYVEGNGVEDYRDEKFTQDVASGSISGEPFSDWAGPISVATGVEYRKEHVTGENDPISNTTGWWVGNYRTFTAGYHVTEGFIETAIPLANDVFLAKNLDFHGAARATDYSTSGYVTTWNVGFTWKPVDGVMLRAQRSRDIRAPNLLELFNTGGGGAPGILNPFLNQETDIIHQNAVGNPNLKPEESDAYGVGIVFQPTFVPGFSASIDFWNMNIKDAITTLSAQQIINNCYVGIKDECAAIGYVPGSQVISTVAVQPFNLATQLVRGIDYEAGYTLPLNSLVGTWPGRLDFRALATNFKKDYLSTASILNAAGQNGSTYPPNWRFSSVVSYTQSAWTVSVTARGLSAGVYNDNYIQCTANCPASTVLNRTVTDNHLPGAIYFDTSLAYKVYQQDSGSNVEVYFNVRNLANRDPAIYANTPGGYSYSLNSDNGYLYDVLGRVYRLGFRTKF